MEAQINILPFLNTTTLYLLLKVLYVVAFLIYVGFSLVVVSQIKQMVQTLNGTLNIPIQLVGWVHLGLSLTALLIAIVVL